MGSVLAEITLRNGGDIVRARDGHITEQNIRSLTVTLTGGSETFCGITEPVEICWKDRTSSVRAWVLPGEEQVLVGVIPLEEKDLIVDPINRKLVGAHGDKMMGPCISSPP